MSVRRPATRARPCQRLVREHVEKLKTAASVPAVSGHILRSVADHGDTGRLLVRQAEQLDAQLLIVGTSTSGPIARLLDDSSTQRLIADATTDVLVVQPEDAPAAT